MSPLRGVVVAHGPLAQALIDAVTRITGPEHGLIAVSNDGCAGGELESRVSLAVAGEPAVVFVDLPSGSCSFAVMRRFRNVADVAIVTGVNLAMLIEFTFHRDLAAAELVERLASAGIGAIGAHR